MQKYSKMTIKLSLEFSKPKGRKKAGGYVNVPFSHLTPSTLISSLVHLRFRRIFVRCVSLDSKSTIFKYHSKMSKRKYELSLVLNSKTSHVISDKIVQRYSAQFKIERHQIERSSRSAVFTIMQFCVFSMQISNCRAYETILRNEFSKNSKDFRKKPTEATIVLYGYCSRVYGFMTG